MQSNTNSTASNMNVKVTPSTIATPNPLMQTAQQLSHGQLAHNDQLQQTIHATQIALDEAKYETPLSAKGQVLVEDAKDLLNSASRLIQEKNADEKFQRLMGHSVGAGQATVGNLSGTSLPIGRSDLTGMRPHARSILDNGRSIGMFAVRSGQFRDLLLEVLDLFQNILRTTSNQIASQPTGVPVTSAVSNVGSQLSNQGISQAQKDAMWNKFVTLLNQLASRPEYYTAIDHLFQIIDHMTEKGRQVRNQTGGTQALPTSHYDQVWSDLKIVFEEFSGTGTMDEFERRNWVLFNAMREDPEARTWSTQFRQFIMDTIRNPTALNDPSRTAYGRQLLDQARYLFQGKHRSHFSDVFDQLRVILMNIKNDSVSQDFSAKLQKFGADFAFDASGKPDLFVIQESLGQMRQILIPVLSRQLNNLPIPRVEGSNPKYDFAVEGLLLSVGDLLPEFVNFRTKSDTRMSVQRLGAQKSSVKVVMEVDRIRAYFKDIKFNYRRKRMPRIEDHGIADVDLSQGTGLSLRIVWKLQSSPNLPMTIRLLKVKCNIDRLAITVRNAKHSILDKLATKLFAGMIKKQVANGIVTNIIKALEPMSVRLNELFKRKPLTGITERMNDGMKNTMFSGQPGVLAKAKDAVVSGAQQLKQAAHSSNTSAPMMGSTPMMSTPITSTGLETPMEQFTFTERSKPGWNFEWYAPSPSDVLETTSTSSNINTTDQKLFDNSRTEQPFVSM